MPKVCNSGIPFHRQTGILQLHGAGTLDRIRNKWLKTLKTAGSGSAASSDKVVVDIGMVGLIYFFTLGGDSIETIFA